MKVKIFFEHNTEGGIKRLEKTINDFFESNDYDIEDTFFRVENDKVLYLVEYDEDGDLSDPDFGFDY